MEAESSLPHSQRPPHVPILSHRTDFLKIHSNLM